MIFEILFNTDHDSMMLFYPTTVKIMSQRGKKYKTPQTTSIWYSIHLLILLTNQQTLLSSVFLLKSRSPYSSRVCLLNFRLLKGWKMPFNTQRIKDKDTACCAAANTPWNWSSGVYLLGFEPSVVRFFSTKEVRNHCWKPYFSLVAVYQELKLSRKHKMTQDRRYREDY